MRQRAFHGVSSFVSALVGYDEDPKLIFRNDVGVALRTWHAPMVYIVRAQLAIGTDVPEVANAEVVLKAYQGLCDSTTAGLRLIAGAGTSPYPA